EVLHGLAERHPSRTIVLVPQPDAPNGIDANVDQQCFPLAGSERSICTETIELHLGGEYASRPASIVMPLLISDLPVFCRWRGEPLAPPRTEPTSPAELLSNELDKFSREPVYEEAVRAAGA